MNNASAVSDQNCELYNIGADDIYPAAAGYPTVLEILGDFKTFLFPELQIGERKQKRFPFPTDHCPETAPLPAVGRPRAAKTAK